MNKENEQGAGVIETTRAIVGGAVPAMSLMASAVMGQQAGDYYARRGYELKARFAGNISRFYGINVQIILNNDVYRNRDYDFATTALSPLNKFLKLQRQVETKAPLQIDEIECEPPLKKTINYR